MQTELDDRRLLPALTVLYYATKQSTPPSPSHRPSEQRDSLHHCVGLIEHDQEMLKRFQQQASN